MDVRSRQELRIGVLVVAGLAALVTLVLVSDRISFDPGYRVTVLMRDAGGLNVGSPVKLSGVEIGTVRSITTNSKGEIRAEAMIQSDYRLSSSMPLELASRGIFSDGYLSFSAPTQPEDQPLPVDGTAMITADSTFIERVSRQADDILTGFSDILNEPNRQAVSTILQNAAALSSESLALVKEVRLHNKDVAGLLAELQVLVRDSSSKVSS